MKSLLLSFASAFCLLANQALAQETDNINNRYGPPTYTGGTLPGVNESYALWYQQNINTQRAYRTTTTPILQMYPNPATTYIRIELDGITTEPCTVSVVNLNGTLVRSYTFYPGASRFEMDISSIPDGLYAVQVQERGKEAQSVQLSKQR